MLVYRFSLCSMLVTVIGLRVVGVVLEFRMWHFEKTAPTEAIFGKKWKFYMWIIEILVAWAQTRPKIVGWLSVVKNQKQSIIISLFTILWYEYLREKRKLINNVVVQYY